MATVRRSPVGEAAGQTVERLELTNDHITVGLLTYGATIQHLLVPDRHGDVTDVVLGFDELADYRGPHPYFGAVIGRYANRIAEGRFSLEGKEFYLAVNDGPNTLHGGGEGFDRRVWSVTVVESGRAASVRLGLTSPDGDMGFPGTLDVSVTYTLDRSDLRISYSAVTDLVTVVNLTNHSYLNLAGSGSVENHVLEIAASRYTPVGADLIPTGELAPVEGTPLDFRAPKRIGADLRAGHDQLLHARGFDHNWVLDGPAGEAVRLAARAYDPGSGRVLEVLTDQPGVQFYSGNLLDGSITGKGGRTYRQGDAFCLETQHFPDAPNRDAFPSTVLRPGEIFSSATVFRFSARPEGSASLTSDP